MRMVRRSGGLLVPARLSERVGFDGPALIYPGLGETLEDYTHFQFPSIREYARNTSSALQKLADDGADSMREYMSPPSITSASALKSAIESHTGTTLKDIVMGFIGNDIPPLVAQVISDLLDMAVDYIVETVSEVVADAVGEALSSIPILGNMVGAVVKFILDAVSAFQAEAKAEEDYYKIACQNRDKVLDNWCNAEVQAAKPTLQTGQGTGFTAADSFRPVLLRATKEQPLPLSVPSLFVMLCGGESQGRGFKSRADYDTWLAQARVTCGKGVGLPRDVQIRMWEIIRGIMAAVETPQLGHISTGDHGRSLYPLLQDIVWQTSDQVIPRPFGQGRSATSGYWNYDFIRALAYKLGEKYVHYERYCDYPSDWHAVPLCKECRGDCGSRVAESLASQFYNCMDQWEGKVLGQYWINGEWSPRAREGLKSKPAKSTLVLKKQVVTKVLDDAVDAYGLGLPKWRRVMDPVMTGLGSLAGGYLAWAAVRKFGPTKGR